MPSFLTPDRARPHPCPQPQINVSEFLSGFEVFVPSFPSSSLLLFVFLLRLVERVEMCTVIIGYCDTVGELQNCHDK